MIICTTGGRDFMEANIVHAAMNALAGVVSLELVGVGDATGADALVFAWCVNRGIPFKVFEADWATHGPRFAGAIRNRKMLDETLPDFLFAFPGGSGTAGCVEEAHQRHIPVVHVLP